MGRDEREPPTHHNSELKSDLKESSGYIRKHVESPREVYTRKNGLRALGNVERQIKSACTVQCQVHGTNESLLALASLVQHLGHTYTKKYTLAVHLKFKLNWEL